MLLGVVFSWRRKALQHLSRFIQTAGPVDDIGGDAPGIARLYYLFFIPDGQFQGAFQNRLDNFYIYADNRYIQLKKTFTLPTNGFVLNCVHLKYSVQQFTPSTIRRNSFGYLKCRWHHRFGCQQHSSVLRAHTGSERCLL